jgi:hypothetical protein
MDASGAAADITASNAHFEHYCGRLMLDMSIIRTEREPAAKPACDLC